MCAFVCGNLEDTVRVFVQVVKVCYSCARTFTYTHHMHECHGNLGTFKDLLELFFFQGGMMVQHSSFNGFKSKKLGVHI